MVELEAGFNSTTKGSTSKRLQDILTDPACYHPHLHHQSSHTDHSKKRRSGDDGADSLRRESTTTTIPSSEGGSPISASFLRSSLNSNSSTKLEEDRRSTTAICTTTTTTTTTTNNNNPSYQSCWTDEISRDQSVGSLLNDDSMDLEVDESHTDFLHVGEEGEEREGIIGEVYFSPRSRTESTYLKPEELPPAKDEETTIYRKEAMVSVIDVLSSESKTCQGLLEGPKMLLLRALFSVPKASDDYKAIAKWVMTLFHTSNKLMYLMQVAIRQEVQCTSIDALFREDTMVCTLASAFLKLAGSAYLQHILRPIISKMAHTKKSFEIDLYKPGGHKNNEKRVRKLVTSLLRGIFESSQLCPANVREFLFYMRSEIRDLHSAAEADCTVRSFFFLRFVCPSIVYPRENGVIEKYPTEEAKRGLCIAARIIQTLANDGKLDTEKQPHLDKLNKLISDNKETVRRYIEGLSNKQVITKELAPETVTNSLSKKLAVEELQKYMYHKIKSLPLNPTQDELLKNEPVIKLRRALQGCARGNNLTRSASSPSGSPSHFANRLALSDSSPAKRRSYVDVFHSLQ